MNKRLSITLLAALAAISAPQLAGAVINPKNQPWHLVKKYANVVACTVTATDAKTRTATLKLDGVAKGDFSAKTITLAAKGQELADAILSLNKGQRVVAYIGKKIPRHNEPNEVLYYIGRGVWYLAKLDGGQANWEVLSNADKGVDASSDQVMFGTFNGETESLWEMMKDAAQNKAYYPAEPLTRFAVQSVMDLGGPVRGVAIYDVNGDGKMDLFACCDAGNRLYLQNDKGEFTDATTAAGLAGTKSVSVSFADADADGDADLLLDGVLYRQADGKFTKTSDVPAGDGKCISAAFVDYNGDGYPDVVSSREEAGLALLVNPGVNGGTFENKSEDAGLTDESNGAGKTGHFEACDWDRDGRMDLIYVVGPGLLLWQNASGAFEPSEIGNADSDFTGGTAAFGMIVRPTLASVYLVAGNTKALVCEDAGNLANVIHSGNEIQDPVVGMLMALADDLNCDGTVDLYTGSKAKGMSSFYVANRGYASFLQPEKYKNGKIIPPAVYNQPTWGIAAGDVNGDGAPDMLIGGLDGKLSLMFNETLADRPARPELGTINDVRKQIQTRIVTVRPGKGKGVCDARLTLLDEAGKPVTYQWIGTNIGVGCRGPAEFVLAIRDPGTYTLSLRLSDGTTRQHKLTIDDKTPRHQVVAMDK